MKTNTILAVVADRLRDVLQLDSIISHLQWSSYCCSGLGSSGTYQYDLRIVAEILWIRSDSVDASSIVVVPDLEANVTVVGGDTVTEEHTR
jgi:hypothetical protein